MKKTWWTILLLLISVTGMVLQAIQTLWIDRTPLFQMFSYFSVQANLLVILYYATALSKKSTFWNSPSFHGATLVYITVMALIYYIAVQEGYHENLAGYGFYANIILHDVIPPLFVIHWFFTSRERYSYIHVLKWLSYPLGYFAYLLISGAIARWYPYPMLSPTDISVFALAIHATLLLYFIALVGLFYVWVNRLQNRLLILFAKQKSPDSSISM